MSVKLQFT